MMNFIKRIGPVALALALASLAWGCKAKSGPAPASPFPESGAIAGWTRSGDVRTFSANNLWEYIDGDAEKYIQAGVSQTQAAEYRFQNKFDVVADIYQMSAPTGAEKIFAAESSAGSQPVQMGDEGRLYKSSLVFRKGPYFVRLTAYEESPELSTGLVDLARGIAGRL